MPLQSSQYELSGGSRFQDVYVDRRKKVVEVRKFDHYMRN